MTNVCMFCLLYPDESDLGASSLSMPSHLDSIVIDVQMTVILEFERRGISRFLYCGDLSGV